MTRRRHAALYFRFAFQTPYFRYAYGVVDVFIANHSPAFNIKVVPHPQGSDVKYRTLPTYVLSCRGEEWG